MKMDESRKKHLKVRAKIACLKKELKDTDKQINCLTKQHAYVDGKKMEAHKSSLKLSEQESSPFQRNLCN